MENSDPVTGNGLVISHKRQRGAPSPQLFIFQQFQLRKNQLTVDCVSELFGPINNPCDVTHIEDKHQYRAKNTWNE